ncbi:hypothetical protein [Bifidobacterium breve]
MSGSQAEIRLATYGKNLSDIAKLAPARGAVLTE